MNLLSMMAAGGGGMIGQANQQATGAQPMGLLDKINMHLFNPDNARALSEAGAQMLTAAGQGKSLGEGIGTGLQAFNQQQEADRRRRSAERLAALKEKQINHSMGMDEKRYGLQERSMEQDGRFREMQIELQRQGMSAEQARFAASQQLQREQMAQNAGFRQQEIDMQRGDQDLKRQTLEYEMKKPAQPPAGFRWSSDGANLEPIPGGPGTQLPAELAARVGLANKFLNDIGGVKASINDGAATGWGDFAWGKAGYGESGKIMRRLDDGVEALQRMMTGAGMNQTEVEDYTRRFRPSMNDTPEVLIDKVNNLETNLKSSVSSAMQGRGGMSVSPQTAGAQPKFLGFE